jgi:hypothetical protein
MFEVDAKETLTIKQQEITPTIYRTPINIKQIECFHGTIYLWALADNGEIWIFSPNDGWEMRSREKLPSKDE